MAEEITIKNKTKEHDLTSGNLARKLVAFTIPILLNSILSLLFTTVDLFTVSKFGGGNKSMGSIGCTATVINLIICLFVGISTGANIVCANAAGRNDHPSAFKATESAILISVIGGLIIGVAGWFLAEPLLIATNCDPELLDGAVLYMKIYFLGSPFMLLFNFGSAVLRAFGDSRRPLYALMISGIFNLFIDILFVAIFKMDIAGVAIATIISQAAGSIATLCFLSYDKRVYANFKFQGLKFYKKETGQILKIGLTQGLQSIIFNITNVTIQAGVNSFGAAAVSGNTISSQIAGYQYNVLNSIGVAAMAMISQNHGAQKKENVIKVLKYAMLLEFGAVFVVGLMLFALRVPLTQILGETKDPNFEEILKYSCDRILIVCIPYFTCGIMETFNAYYRGIGYTLFPTIVTIFGSAISRLFFYYVLFKKVAFFHSFNWLMACYPISWVLTCIIYSLFIKRFSDKAFSKYKLNQPNQLGNELAK